MDTTSFISASPQPAADFSLSPRISHSALRISLAAKALRISLAYLQTVILDEADQMLEQRLETRQ